MPSIRIAKELSSSIYYLTFTIKNWYYIFDRHNRFQILADSMNLPAAETAGYLKKIYHRVVIPACRESFRKILDKPE